MPVMKLQKRTLNELEAEVQKALNRHNEQLNVWQNERLDREANAEVENVASRNSNSRVSALD
jgi:hypothetical protein